MRRHVAVARVEVALCEEGKKKARSWSLDSFSKLCGSKSLVQFGRGSPVARGNQLLPHYDLSKAHTSCSSAGASTASLRAAAASLANSAFSLSVQVASLNLQPIQQFMTPMPSSRHFIFISLFLSKTRPLIDAHSLGLVLWSSWRRAFAVCRGYA